ncbi:MAG TPA: MFS transporter [Steroidobacteraceae bacterium]|nr:MFS transporter [Steroidobacteraceae bacterium]
MTERGRAVTAVPSIRYAWYVAGLLTLAQIVSYLDRFLPSLLVQPIKQDLRLNDLQIGLLLGPAFVFFYAVLAIPLGWLADRMNRRAILAFGIAIWCTLTAAGAAAHTFVSFFITRLGVGLGEATVAPTSISLIGDYFSRDRQPRAVSLFMSGTFLGAGFSFLFFGPLVHYIETLHPVSLPLLGQLQSWRLCFLVVGAPGLLLTVLMLTVREPARQDRVSLAVSSRGTVRNDAGASSFSSAFTYILDRWRAFGTLFVASSCNVMMGALGLWNVSLFKRTWDWNVAQVGVAIGVIFFTAGPLGTLLGVFLTNRDLGAGKRDATLRALFVGLVIGVPAYAVFPLMSSAMLALLVLFCAQVGQAMATAAGPATLVMLAPGQIRAQATAIYYLVISLAAQLIGPPLVGLITDLLGSTSALRYAVAIEAAVLGVPSILLTWRGFDAYRRSVTELDSRFDGMPVAPAAVMGAHR